MGLFSKHKKEDAPLPPAPAPSSMGSAQPQAPPTMNVNNQQNTSEGSNKKAASVNSMSPALNSPPIPEVADGTNLSHPPLPGGSLNEIKEQVAGNNSDSQDASYVSDKSDSKPVDTGNFSSDELFEMFEIGGENLDQKDKLDKTIAKEDKSEDRIEPALSEGLGLNKKSVNSVPNSEAVDTSFRGDSNLHYRSQNLRSSAGSGESTFLTTNQFKLLLEIVEGVKTRAKESTETHLRLLDMKSEEDVEYENLRKDFQFIEDKLYELDTILFEK